MRILYVVDYIEDKRCKGNYNLCALFKSVSNTMTIRFSMKNKIKKNRRFNIEIRTPATLAWVSALLMLQACASNTGSRHVSGAEMLTTASGSLDGKLVICPMKVSNAPIATDGEVVDFYPSVLVDGVQLLTAPVQGACLSSGYGKRRGRMHKGVDYHQRPAGPVFVAGDGTVIEAMYRRDYGYMILLDHGSSVYTRYAHLDSFNDGIRVGKKVNSGEVLGQMGSSGSTRAVHLHYEILTGDYATPKRSFGLRSRNPFKQ